MMHEAPPPPEVHIDVSEQTGMILVCFHGREYEISTFDLGQFLQDHGLVDNQTGHLTLEIHGSFYEAYEEALRIKEQADAEHAAFCRTFWFRTEAPPIPELRHEFNVLPMRRVLKEPTSELAPAFGAGQRTGACRPHDSPCNGRSPNLTGAARFVWVQL